MRLLLDLGLSGEDFIFLFVGVGFIFLLLLHPVSAEISPGGFCGLLAPSLVSFVRVWGHHSLLQDHFSCATPQQVSFWVGQKTRKKKANSGDFWFVVTDSTHNLGQPLSLQLLLRSLEYREAFLGTIYQNDSEWKLLSGSGCQSSSRLVVFFSVFVTRFFLFFFWRIIFWASPLRHSLSLASEFASWSWPRSKIMTSGWPWTDVLARAVSLAFRAPSRCPLKSKVWKSMPWSPSALDWNPRCYFYPPLLWVCYQ